MQHLEVSSAERHIYIYIYLYIYIYVIRRLKVKHLHSQCTPSWRGALLSTLLTLQLPFCTDRFLYE